MVLFQVSERVVTASQEKHSKTITARITARNDVGKTVGSKLQLMGVAPPITSVMVERHHPVTQVLGNLNAELLLCYSLHEAK